MKLIGIPLTLIFAALITSCATSSVTVGNNFDSTKVNEIKKGQTTKSELLQMFGEPYTKTVVSSNEENWQYYFSTNTAKAQSYIFTTDVQTSGSYKNLSILLKEDVVSNFTFTERNSN